LDLGGPGPVDRCRRPRDRRARRRAAGDEQSFRLEGASAALAALIALAALTLVLPTFTTSSPGSSYTSKQLAFAAVASLVLWGVFVFVQTVRHRDYFLPPVGAADEDRLDELRIAARRAGRRDRPGQDPVAHSRARR